MLPVVETDMENMTNLIPTNVMSMTDGHTLFMSTLHAEGKYPAADVAKSVTRVGKQTQLLVHKVLADKSMALLTEYAELERFSRFGSDLAEETKRTLKRGRVMQEVISQPMGVFIEASYQIIFLGLIFAGYFDDKDIPFIHQKKIEIIEFLKKNSTFSSMAAKIKDYKFPDLIKALETAKDEIEKGIHYEKAVDDTQQSEEKKPAEAKPSESKPAETKTESANQSAVSKVKEAMDKNQTPATDVKPPETPAPVPPTPEAAPTPATQATPEPAKKSRNIFSVFRKK
jgi:hypothetical protein